ncbi:class I SAM-dependent methyltransferase [Robertkochia solimangrovi]|uniref:class I SAM-dependent methyltransferase n=1 Tax=Robertkochia solimangrovi TaxID=2213046 RepID=UPI0030D09AFF
MTEIDGVDIKLIAGQIEARNKAENKLPEWFASDQIYYPAKVSIEQTSSSATARFKASLVNGKKLIDLTGGFGVDCFFFAERFDAVTHCELNEELSEIVTHNYEVLGKKNITTRAIDGIEALRSSEERYDWIYVDPSRRNDVKGKVFLLEDCLPDIPTNLDLLLSKSDNIMIKTSPMLDLQKGVEDLQMVLEIYVVAVDNEVKELLWILGNIINVDHEISIHAINIDKNSPVSFTFSKEQEAQTPAYGKPEIFLYEPNAAILKAGAFNSIASSFNLKKLHQHTHLYTNEVYIDFPGRVFVIEKVLPYKDKKSLKKELSGTKANITTRNFPESVADIRKKFKIKDGGDAYLFFCTDPEGQRQVIFCKKV